MAICFLLDGYDFFGKSVDFCTNRDCVVVVHVISEEMLCVIFG